MPQITLNLDQETIRRMNEAASEAGLSVSGWVARLVRDSTVDLWPPEVQALVGAWADDVPTQEEIRENEVPDLPRHSF